MTEDQYFIIEAALNHGFIMVDDDGTILQCTQEQLVSLVEAYRERAKEALNAKEWK